jgi:hypothetical protein
VTPVDSLDVHSAWGPDRDGVIDRHQPEHIVLHTYHNFEAAQHAVTFRHQVASVQARGVSVGCYAWCFRGYDPIATVRETVDLFRDAAGHDPPVWWADLETYDDGSYSDPGPDAVWLRAAFGECDRLGLRAGAYTAFWWLDGHFPGGQAAFSEFSNRYLWIANWDRNPALESPLPLGFTTLHGKQWAVRLPPHEEIDRDVFLPEVTVPMAGPVEPPAPPDQTAGLINALAYVCDDVLPKAALSKLKRDRKAALAEGTRVREQVLGPKPAA